MGCSTPGFRVLYCLLEFAQTHVHWVGDAIQTSHTLLYASPPTLNISWHQCLFQWVDSAHQMAKVLELQHQSFQWIFRTDFLSDGLVGSPCSPRDSLESSPTTVLKHKFFRAQPSLWSYSHIRTWLLEKPQLWLWTFVGKVMSLLFNTLSKFIINFLPEASGSRWWSRRTCDHLLWEQHDCN